MSEKSVLKTSDPATRGGITGYAVKVPGLSEMNSSEREQAMREAEKAASAAVKDMGLPSADQKPEPAKQEDPF
jgi:hypothetical protein